MISQNGLEAFHSALEADSQDIPDFLNESYQEIVELFETGSVVVNNGAFLLELVVTRPSKEDIDELA